jgi:hypothetical protein
MKTRVLKGGKLLRRPESGRCCGEWADGGLAVAALVSWQGATDERAVRSATNERNSAQEQHWGNESGERARGHGEKAAAEQSSSREDVTTSPCATRPFGAGVVLRGEVPSE